MVPVAVQADGLEGLHAGLQDGGIVGLEVQARQGARLEGDALVVDDLGCLGHRGRDEVAAGLVARRELIAGELAAGRIIQAPGDVLGGVQGDRVAVRIEDPGVDRGGLAARGEGLIEGLDLEGGRRAWGHLDGRLGPGLRGVLGVFSRDVDGGVAGGIRRVETGGGIDGSRAVLQGVGDREGGTGLAGAIRGDGFDLDAGVGVGGHRGLPEDQVSQGAVGDLHLHGGVDLRPVAGVGGCQAEPCDAGIEGLEAADVLAGWGGLPEAVDDAATGEGIGARVAAGIDRLDGEVGGLPSSQGTRGVEDGHRGKRSHGGLDARCPGQVGLVPGVPCCDLEGRCADCVRGEPPRSGIDLAGAIGDLERDRVLPWVAVGIPGVGVERDRCIGGGVGRCLGEDQLVQGPHGDPDLPRALLGGVVGRVLGGGLDGHVADPVRGEAAGGRVDAPGAVRDVPRDRVVPEVAVGVQRPSRGLDRGVGRCRCRDLHDDVVQGTDGDRERPGRRVHGPVEAGVVGDDRPSTRRGQLQGRHLPGGVRERSDRRLLSIRDGQGPVDGGRSSSVAVAIEADGVHRQPVVGAKRPGAAGIGASAVEQPDVVQGASSHLDARGHVSLDLLVRVVGGDRALGAGDPGSEGARRGRIGRARPREVPADVPVDLLEA